MVSYDFELLGLAYVYDFAFFVFYNYIAVAYICAEIKYLSAAERNNGGFAALCQLPAQFVIVIYNKVVTCRLVLNTLALALP